MVKKISKSELKKGIVHEKEHLKTLESPSSVKSKIRQTAIDHLKEIPDYYTRLAKMEKDAKNKRSH